MESVINLIKFNCLSTNPMRFLSIIITENRISSLLTGPLLYIYIKKKIIYSHNNFFKTIACLSSKRGFRVHKKSYIQINHKMLYETFVTNVTVSRIFHVIVACITVQYSSKGSFSLLIKCKRANSAHVFKSKIIRFINFQCNTKSFVYLFIFSR